MLELAVALLHTAAAPRRVRAACTAYSLSRARAPATRSSLASKHTTNTHIILLPPASIIGPPPPAAQCSNALHWPAPAAPWRPTLSPDACVTCHTSHVTNVSHVTRHTSHITRHNPHPHLRVHSPHCERGVSQQIEPPLQHPAIHRRRRRSTRLWPPVRETAHVLVNLPTQSVGAAQGKAAEVVAACNLQRFGVWGLGFGVWGSGFGVWGLGFGVWGLGFRVWGLAYRLHALLELLPDARNTEEYSGTYGQQALRSRDI